MDSQLTSKTQALILFAWGLLWWTLRAAVLGLLSAYVTVGVVAGFTGIVVVNWFGLWVGCTVFWITLASGKSFITGSSMMSRSFAHLAFLFEEDSLTP